MGYAEEVQKARAQMSYVGTVQGLAHATLRYLDLLHNPRMFLEELASKAFHEAREKHRVAGLWIGLGETSDDGKEQLDCWVVWSNDAHVPFHACAEVEKIVSAFMYTKANVKSVTPRQAGEHLFFVENRFLVVLGEKPPTKLTCY